VYCVTQTTEFSYIFPVQFFCHRHHYYHPYEKQSVINSGTVGIGQAVDYSDYVTCSSTQESGSISGGVKVFLFITAFRLTLGQAALDGTLLRTVSVLYCPVPSSQRLHFRLHCCCAIYVLCLSRMREKVQIRM
jgi:hypothetical protein